MSSDGNAPQGPPPRFIRPVDVGQPVQPPPPSGSRASRPRGQGRRVTKLVATWIATVLVAFPVALALGIRSGLPSALWFQLPSLITIFVATRPFHREVLAHAGHLRRGEPAHGSVVALEEVGIIADRLQYRRVPVVRFTAADGRDVVGAAASPRINAVVGEAIAIRYDRDAPAWFVPDFPHLPAPLLALWSATDALAHQVMLVLTLVGLVVIAQTIADPAVLPTLVASMVLLVGLATRMLRRKVNEYSARYERAIEVDATIVDVARDRRGRTQQATVAYRTNEGQEIVARAQAFVGRRSPIASPSVGAAIRVLYDPQRPNWVTLPFATPGRARRALRIHLAVVFAWPLIFAVLYFLPVWL